MLFVSCPFCHRKVLRVFYAGHRAKHTAPLLDGQMKDQVTVHRPGATWDRSAAFPQA